MNFTDAQELLKKGRKIRLPEWTGYWFMEGDQIKVFTRTGQVLDTPMIEEFKGREDWQVASDGLGFDFAVIALKAGSKVARKGWNGKGMFVFMRPGDAIDKSQISNIKSLPQTVKDFYSNYRPEAKESIYFNPYLCLKAADGTIVNGWLASQTDILAEDWAVVEEAKSEAQGTVAGNGGNANLSEQGSITSPDGAKAGNEPEAQQ